MKNPDFLKKDFKHFPENSNVFYGAQRERVELLERDWIGANLSKIVETLNLEITHLLQDKGNWSFFSGIYCGYSRTRKYSHQNSFPEEHFSLHKSESACKDRYSETQNKVPFQKSYLFLTHIKRYSKNVSIHSGETLTLLNNKRTFLKRLWGASLSGGVPNLSTAYPLEKD